MAQTNPSLVSLPRYSDERGSLVVSEQFPTARAFWVYDTHGPRGGHSHETCEQLLISVSGVATVEAGRDNVRCVFALDNPAKALHLPAGWFVQYETTGILLVLCSEKYNESEMVHGSQK